MCDLLFRQVGFYQISKILVTPAVMAINLLAYGEGTTTQVKVAVSIMIVGVTMATVTDVQVDQIGLLIGIVAILAAAQQQIFIGKMQKDLKASANQLLVGHTPVSSLLFFVVAPLDMKLPNHSELTLAEWYHNEATTNALLMIGFSGCIGLLVSLSTFLMIGATSALTYNIVGHLKTLAVLTMGVVIFGDSLSIWKMTGIGFALTGVIWYSKIKLDLQQIGSKDSIPSKA